VVAVSERETWPHESCFECRLRMPSDKHADAHYHMTGHQMGWPLSANEMDWPVATEEQVVA
jgi:hypothetical protein